VTVEKKIDKSQVRKHFSVHAAEYDRYAVVQQIVAKRLIELLWQQACNWRQALEVGCGTGLLSRQFFPLQPGQQLVLADLAHGMCQSVQQTFPKAKICSADAAALPFACESFDLFVSSSVYQWLNDLPNAFAEIGRVLRPGGTLALALFGEQTLYELRSSHRAVLGGEKSHVQNFPSIKDISSALASCFRVIGLHSEFEIEWHANVPDLLRSLKKIGAQNASQKRPQGLASRQVMQQMAACYEKHYRRDQGIPATYEVIYLLARKC